MSSQGRDKQEGYSSFRAFFSANEMQCRLSEDNKTHPLYIINNRLGRHHTMALSQGQPLSVHLWAYTVTHP